MNKFGVTVHLKILMGRDDLIEGTEGQIVRLALSLIKVVIGAIIVERVFCSKHLYYFFLTFGSRE